MEKLHDLTGEALKNKIEELLHSTGRKNIEAVIKYLAERDFYTAPASTKFHGNYEAALAEHSYNVYLLLKKKNEDYKLGLSDANVIISGLLHDVCKIQFYKIGSRNVKNEKSGQWEKKAVYEVEDQLPMGHGAKSLYILQNMIRLELKEALLIRWHMGMMANEGDSQYGFNTAVAKEPAICAMFTADMEAANLFEEIRK